jgi:hypothetical protein
LKHPTISALPSNLIARRPTPLNNWTNSTGNSILEGFVHHRKAYRSRSPMFPLLSPDLIVSNHRDEMMAGADVAVRFGPVEDASTIARKLLDTQVLIWVAPPISLGKARRPATPHHPLLHETILFHDQ